MSLTTPISVQKLQTALHAKAKESPGFRFYALYDKVYRRDVLAYAYERCKANGGAAGVDNQTFEELDDSAESGQSLLVYLFVGQQLWVVEEIPQEPAQLPHHFLRAIETTNNGLPGQRPGLDNREP